jgi:hypothetical protein
MTLVEKISMMDKVGKQEQGFAKPQGAQEKSQRYDK